MSSLASSYLLRKACADMCVCAWTHVCVCAWTHVCVCMHTYVCACMCVHVCQCVCVCVSVSACICGDWKQLREFFKIISPTNADTSAINLKDFPIHLTFSLLEVPNRSCLGVDSYYVYRQYSNAVEPTTSEKGLL